MSDTAVRALLVGQLPPPVHGQAEVNALLERAPFERLELGVVGMQVSRDVGEVSRFRARNGRKIRNLVVESAAAEIIRVRL